MVSRLHPRLFKVGFTKRRTKDRRSELNRVAGDDMKIVMTVTMPWAAFLERAVLKVLRRSRFCRADRRGTEWFELNTPDGISKVEKLLKTKSSSIHRSARFRLSWPKNVEPRFFYSKAR